MQTARYTLFAAVLAAAVRAQEPLLYMDPAQAIGASGAVTSYFLSASPGALAGVFVDLDGGPVDLLGERFYLGLGPSTTPLAIGVVQPGSSLSGALNLPLFPGLAGLTIYAQGIVLDASAPNGLFRVSNGASTILYAGVTAVVADFENPQAAGYSGSYADDVAGHLRGGPVTTRTHRTIDPQGQPLGLPIYDPLSLYGCREQLVLRTQDVGATGAPELLVGIRWMPFPWQPLQNDYFPQFEIRAGHTAVVPDYSIDPTTQLPAAPLSGLVTTFAANQIAGAPPQVLYHGPLFVDPGQQLPNAYLPYPLAATFAYDGVSSLLLEFRTWPVATLGLNATMLRLMVQSDAHPFGRVFSVGNQLSWILPDQQTVGAYADNGMADLELVFARVETFALSPWQDSGLVSPVYGSPLLAQSLPFGTSIGVEFRGSDSALGSSPTAWSSSPAIADGHRFLQFRVTLRANHLTGQRPLLDTLVVPAS